MSFIKKTIIFSKLLLIGLFLIGCQDDSLNKSNSQITVTIQSPAIKPSTIPNKPTQNAEIIPAESTQSSTATSEPLTDLLPNKSVLIEYNPGGREIYSDIWILKPPFTKVQPLRLHNEEYVFCCPKWSLDGRWIAYLQNSVNNPSSILFVHDLENSVDKQVGENIDLMYSIPPGVATLHLYGWSADSRNLYFFSEGKYFSANIETGDIETFDVPPKLINLGIEKLSLYFRQYNASTGQLLSSGDRRFLIVPFGNLKQVKVLEAPEEFTPVGRDFWLWNTNLSPDGKFLVVPDYNENSRTERLWLADIENETWSIVVSNPLKFLPTFVEWSADGQWIAWWRIIYTNDGKYTTNIYFINVSSWEIKRHYEMVTRKPSIMGWVLMPDYGNRFAILVPQEGEGIWLLGPAGNESDDTLLIKYEELLEQLPFLPESVDEWIWQP